MNIFSNFSERLPFLGIVAFCFIGALLLGWKFIGSNLNSVEVTVPVLSDPARTGKIAFDANCAVCHGPDASGSDQGPPLIHNIYNPGHHADISFVMAAKKGVRGHHWRFGNMPPQPQVDDASISLIIRYVREVQIANGIVYQAHKM
ncbi:MAG: cytochrome c [Alphaproteobacteria bacterium]|jgi:mono/diheme cytochrome c family protein|nr:cytochrome c [Alphaproteobacteria bacterium]MBT4020173.1 cytochrome c [Alphaproteobacteria bacterium]MBT4964640.1 cytochrome c [Alphaproteobacteria bacterium]MBT5159281.1 cytochrome c [Alphaproteobacteria bacterium]MBT5918498.1 cytochrome c [Alphaproteobacteria bacterium]